MKQSAFLLEKYLVLITLLIFTIGGFLMLFKSTSSTGGGLLLTGMIWLMPFGAIQVLHAIYLRINYDSFSNAKYHLNIYLFIVILYFLALILFNQLTNSYEPNQALNNFLLIPLFITPPALAFYLLWICWQFREINDTEPCTS